MLIDIKDKKILSLLDKDCRLSSNQIAKTIKLSQEAVNYRIKRLEKNKIIEGYFAQINFFKLGYKLVRMYIKLQNTSQKTIQNIISFTLSEGNLWTLYETDGNCDFAIGLLVRNLNECTEFQNKLINQFGEHIASKEISVFTGIAYFPKKYLDNQKKDYNSFYIEETNSVEKIDEIDNKILKLLTNDAKTHILSIAKKVNLTANAVKYRLKQMEKKKL